MGKLKALLLTEGMHGMISQVEGMAKALNAEFNHKIVRLSFPWNPIPPKFTPISNIILKDKIYLTENETPDLIISCGRKSVIPSIYLKKNSKKKVYNIHIQNPKVSLSHFDFIISPEHDNLVSKNVIQSKGAIHYLTLDEIKHNHDYLLHKLNKNQDYLTLILGGPNKYYDYSNENIKKVFDKIKRILDENNLQLIAIPSMRTPKKTIDLANEYFANNNLIVNNIDKKAYLSGLSLAKFIIVTCDSTSMISESALTGKPIYVAELPPKKNDYRFKKFRELFTKLNIIKNLDEKLTIWNYENLDETNRIAKEIKKKLF